jgi:hypothetical protein
MSRDLTSDVLVACQAETFRLIHMVELVYDAGTVRTTSLPYGMDIQYGGNTWYALGDLGKIRGIKEVSDISVTDVEMILSGVIPENISIALNEYSQGRDCTIYFALLDESHQVINNPVSAFKGLLDNQKIRLGKEASIYVTAKSRLARLFTAKESRYNNESQQARYPGDRGLEFVESVVRTELQWGSGKLQNGKSVLVN